MNTRRFGFKRQLWYTQGQGRRASPSGQRPSGRKISARGCHRVGVGHTDKDFSRPSQPCPRCSIVLHQTHRPPMRTTTALQTSSPSYHGQRTKASGTKEGLETKERGGSGHVGGSASTVNGGTHPDMPTRGTPGPPSPAEHIPT
jgi:hypothetical protein